MLNRWKNAALQHCVWSLNSFFSKNVHVLWFRDEFIARVRGMTIVFVGIALQKLTNAIKIA